MSTCRKSEGDQVGEEVTGKVPFALVKGCCNLPPDLLSQLGAHHGGNALRCLLIHLQPEQETQSLEMALFWLVFRSYKN